MATFENRVIMTGLGLLLLAIPCVFCTPSHIRGVHPSLEAHYVLSKEKFTCTDGSRTVPISQLNDGYCDCYDGSDEPGTAACPNGSFYCPNFGSESLLLNSSFVDDGVCDCCDGSDEPRGECRNTCKEAASAAVAELTAHLAEAEAGLKARSKYVKAAAQARLGWKKRLEEISKLEGPAKTKVESSATERDRLSKQIESLKVKKRDLEARLPAARSRSMVVNETKGEFPEVTEEIEPSETAGAQPADVDNGAIPKEDSGPNGEESAEDIAKRVASQWIPGAGSKEDAEVADQMEDEHEQEEEGFEDDGDVDEAEQNEAARPVEEEGSSISEDIEPEVTTPGGFFGALSGKVVEMVARLRGVAPDAAEMERIESSLEAVRKRFQTAQSTAHDADSALRALEEEKESLVDKLSKSYGPNDVYAALADRCVEASVDKYTYKLCPFNKAEQVEGGRSTSLGSWAGLEEIGASFNLKFGNGDRCWQGPARSMHATARCGTAEELSRVHEPSRCEYAAELTTPAACSEEGVEKLRSALATKRALLDALPKDEL